MKQVFYIYSVYIYTFILMVILMDMHSYGAAAPVTPDTIRPFHFGNQGPTFRLGLKSNTFTSFKD